MYSLFLFLCVISESLSLSDGIITSDTPHYRLHNDVLQHYNKHLIPITDVKDNISIQLDVHLLKIILIDEVNGMVKFMGQSSYKWRDKLLQWDSSKYNHIFSLQMHLSKIWVPHFSGVQTGESLNSHIEWGKVLLEHSGMVEFKDSLQVNVPCQMHYRYFPFDVHKCSLDINFDERQLVMSWKSTVHYPEHKISNQWKMIYMTSFLNKEKELHIQFQLARNGLSFLLSCVWPSFLISVTVSFYILGTNSTSRDIIIGLVMAIFLLANIRLLASIQLPNMIFQTVTSYDIFYFCQLAIVGFTCVVKVFSNFLRLMQIRLNLNSTCLKFLHYIHFSLCILDVNTERINYWKFVEKLSTITSNSNTISDSHSYMCTNTKHLSEDTPTCSSIRGRKPRPKPDGHDDGHENKPMLHYYNNTQQLPKQVTDQNIADSNILQNLIKVIEIEQTNQESTLASNILICVFERLLLILIITFACIVMTLIHIPEGL